MWIKSEGVYRIFIVGPGLNEEFLEFLLFLYLILGFFFFFRIFFFKSKLIRKKYKRQVIIPKKYICISIKRM